VTEERNMVRRSAPFWNFTQRRRVVCYRRFGITYRSHLQESSGPRRTAWPLEIGTIGCPKTSVTTTSLRCSKSQKSADLIYTAAEMRQIWNTKQVSTKMNQLIRRSLETLMSLNIS